jgi:hypothetical protein
MLRPDNGRSTRPRGARERWRAGRPECETRETAVYPSCTCEKASAELKRRRPQGQPHRPGSTRFSVTMVLAQMFRHPPRAPGRQLARGGLLPRRLRLRGGSSHVASGMLLQLQGGSIVNTQEAKSMSTAEEVCTPTSHDEAPSAASRCSVRSCAWRCWRRRWVRGVPKPGWPARRQPSAGAAVHTLGAPVFEAPPSS